MKIFLSVRAVHPAGIELLNCLARTIMSLKFLVDGSTSPSKFCLVSETCFVKKKKGTLTQKPESLSFLYIIPGTSMGTYRIIKNTRISPKR